MPEPFQQPRSHVIQKTPGYMAFHRLAPIVYRKRSSGSAAAFARVFHSLSAPKFGAKFWERQNLRGAKGYGTGQSAYANLAVDLQEYLGL